MNAYATENDSKNSGLLHTTKKSLALGTIYWKKTRETVNNPFIESPQPLKLAHIDTSWRFGGRWLSMF